MLAKSRFANRTETAPQTALNPIRDGLPCTKPQVGAGRRVIVRQTALRSAVWRTVC